MSIDRSEVDQKLTDMGYVHPTNDNRDTNPYKQYSEQGENVYISNGSGNPYGVLGKDDVCPECYNKALYKCPCPIGEFMCSLNHMWYVKNGKVISEDPHKKKSK